MDLTTLNPMQRKAVETLEGPLLVLAGAGSGKTRTVTYRIANLIEHGVQPWHILSLTFTNKAAREMKERVERLLGAGAGDMWIGTFHSICVRILRRDIDKLGYQRSFTIYDEDDQNKIIKDGIKHLNLDENKVTAREVRGCISTAKNHIQTPDEWFQQSAKDYHAQQIHDVMIFYEERLKAANALDFDDLLNRTLELFIDHPPVLQYYQQRFTYVHVDEYQDSNEVQYRLIQLLTQESRNLCVVGDDDQSIYGWRGADVRIILDFEKDFPDAVVIKLEQNYRSSANILDAANQVIAHNQGRKEKVLWTEAPEGEKIRVFGADDERVEAAWICEQVRKLQIMGEPLSQIAVLYRMHAQSRIIEEMFVRAGIPYHVYGGTKFYDRKEIRDVLAYLRILVNPSDDVSLIRIINTPKRSIGDSTVALLQDYAQENGYPVYTVINDPPESLSSRPRKCINDFAMLLMKLSVLKDTLPVTELVKTVLKETGLQAQYESMPENEEAQSRLENLMEFVGSAQQFENTSEDKSLEAFLEQIALMTDLDRSGDGPSQVTIMTLHTAKGLEFDHVLIAGMEDGIFPSNRSAADEKRMEEERRLCYVGLTRARKRLYLSYARRRMLFNQTAHNPPSKFLKEIPERLLLDEWTEVSRSHFPEEPAKPAAPQRRERTRNLSFGNPGMSTKPVALNIPGVQKGFTIPSIASTISPAPDEKKFAPGDKVLHKKFGEGVVNAVTGEGSDARIQITFTAYGQKEFSVSIAPIVKI